MSLLTAIRDRLRNFTGHEVSLCADCPPEEAPPVFHVEHDLPPEKPGKGALYHVETTVHKYRGDFTAEQIAAGEADHALYEITKDGGNLITTSGATRLLERLIGTASKQAMDNTHTFVGVGNNSTAAAAGNTDLAASTGSTNRQWKGLDATYPTQSGASITLKATYGSTEGNFVAGWLEWGVEIDDGTSSPGTAALSTSTQKLFSRKVPSGGLGVKSAGTTWTLTITYTVATT